MKIHLTILTTTALFAPLFAFAQPESFSSLVDNLIKILFTLVPLVIAITILTILWAGAQIILNSDDPKKRIEGRQKLIWGIVVLFMMVSVWGFVNILRSVLLFN